MVRATRLTTTKNVAIFDHHNSLLRKQAAELRGLSHVTAPDQRCPCAPKREQIARGLTATVFKITQFRPPLALAVADESVYRWEIRYYHVKRDTHHCVHTRGCSSKLLEFFN